MPDEIVNVAVAAVRLQSGSFEALDHLPNAIYATNDEGRITYFNQACIGFSGRTPALGDDSWCVSWKLYTEDGTFLPHDQCPMAVAIKEKRAVRGVEAIAERPDGTRVSFRPYPTPVLDEDGKLIGAVNLLLDITNRKQAQHLREQAKKCRRLARATTDRRTIDALSGMAVDYDQMAIELEQAD